MAAPSLALAITDFAVAGAARKRARDLAAQGTTAATEVQVVRISASF